MDSEIISKLRDDRERFIFQGGSKFAVELADLIEQMAQRELVECTTCGAEVVRVPGKYDRVAQVEPVAATLIVTQEGDTPKVTGWQESAFPLNEEVAVYLAPPARGPLTDEQIYQAKDAARESYRAHSIGIRGQMLTIRDDMDWHLVRAVEQAHGIGSEK